MRQRFRRILGHTRKQRLIESRNPEILAHCLAVPDIGLAVRRLAPQRTAHKDFE